LVKDYYQILQVSQGISSKEIYKSYKRLALQFHPDVNKAPDAHQKFVLILEAYEVLRNPIRRRKYDRLYNIQIIEKKNKKRYNKKKTQQWEAEIKKKEAKGHAKAEKCANQSQEEFKYSSGWGEALTGIFEFLDFFFRLFEIFS